MQKHNPCSAEFLHELGQRLQSSEGFIEADRKEDSREIVFAMTWLLGTFRIRHHPEVLKGPGPIARVFPFPERLMPLQAFKQYRSGRRLDIEAGNKLY